MANSAFADLMSIGQHCSVAGCGQRDFLPFKCDCCARTFCLEHRTYASHSCPAAGGRSTEAIECPLCARAVKIGPGQDANEAFELHQRQGCDTSNYNRVHKKPTCPVKGCRQKLVTINRYQCKTCQQIVCMEHRMAADHDCEAFQKARQNERRSNWTFFSNTSGSSQSIASGSIRPSAQSTRSNQHSQARALATGGGEVCPQCRQRFRSIQELISHAEQQHGINSCRPTDFDSCPTCGERFSDPVKLVAHVEKKKCRGRSVCVLA